ncbi:MAG: HAD family hydrolase [Deltaproteobacteria bacterium]|nr:HAD family hydrolase [Deltaproteobacteria bacterium]
MSEVIRAVSFDLWDTVFIDDSDEPKRAAQGLGTKVEARQRVVLEALRQHHAATPAQVEAAYRSSTAKFNRIWHDEFRTLTVPQRMGMLLDDLGMTLPPPALNTVITAWEEMEYHLPPDLAPGIGDALEALAGRYGLAVISDAIVSPGRVLRLILKKYGLLDFFTVFTFSDEIGASKPAPVVFTDTALRLGVPPSAVAHIGDRPHNDVQGPHLVGMKSILYDGVKKRPLEGHIPGAVCSDYARLPEIIAGLGH